MNRHAHAEDALFGEENAVIAHAAGLLEAAAGDGEALRRGFEALLASYKKLHRQSVRLTAINDRNQMALRDSHHHLQSALEQLRGHQEKLANEQRTVERVLTRMRRCVHFDDAGVRHLLLPAERVAGDLLFSQRRPDGVRHILIGDITGHGLPAAIVGPMVSDIFHTMTAKGFSSGTILAELNRQLRHKIPVGIYLAAAMVALDPENHLAAVWNGGMPEGVVFRGQGIIHRLPSRGLPLGIVDNAQQALTPVALPLAAGDRLVLYSDGLIEATDGQRQAFGQERLEGLLTALMAGEEPLDGIVAALARFQGEPKRDDDISIVEITC